MLKYLSLLLFLILPLLSWSQKKTTSAQRISGTIRIDGELNEIDWQKAPIATDFIEYLPYSGRQAMYKTDVKILYDNSGIYIGAMMYDPSPDSILTQLGLRDAVNLNADYFSVELSPYNDGINAFVFQLFASDVQTDFKLPQESEEDLAWDAVWYSKAKVNANGWVAEIKIPYSAIRFPKTDGQEWGINLIRDIRRYRERSTWNFIDKKVEGTVNQEGVIQGISNIKPPLRLSVSPYVSGYVEKNPDNQDWQFSYNYGADLKYGINQSFTLDMTLIPDFGQVASDDKIYNFSPFEIRYDEKRQFFTEGTELFNKGGIFYSRRIGDQPKGYNSVVEHLDTNEYISENPMQVKLYNASKVSGRTSKGLGIGVFNAISGNTWATVVDSTTGEERRVMTQGTTNYNMIVFNQALKNNSYIDLLNTNYFIPESGYCANVSGTQFKIANKKYTYAVYGDGFVSQKYTKENSPDLGYRYNLGFGKISGNFLFNFDQVLETDTYDPNDMGYNSRNNKFNNEVNFQYNIYEPFWKLLSWENSFGLEYNCLYTDLKYTDFVISGGTHIKTQKYNDAGLQFVFQPFKTHDYYEPRVPGYMYIAPAEYKGNIWISTDYRKKFAIDAILSLYDADDNSYGVGITLEPRYRANDRLFFTYSFTYENVQNNIGYVETLFQGDTVSTILFGKRDIYTLVNVLQGNYMFNSKMSLDFRVRHYWVVAPYSDFYHLQTDGTLNPTSYIDNQDINFNQFNLYLTYIWNFAPGSQLSFVWQNGINTYSNDTDITFFNNLSNTLTSPASNSFSVKILYYLDALYFRKAKKG